MGRPTLCTPDVIAAFEKYMRAGCTLDDAAALLGFSRSAAFDWKARGEAGESPFADFSDAVTRAAAEFKAECLAGVASGRMMNGDRDWKAQAFVLERRFPAEYGPQQVVAVKVEQQLEKALDRLDAIKDKIGADAYHLVCAAILGEPPPEEAGGEGGGSLPG
jgi:transposase